MNTTSALPSKIPTAEDQSETLAMLQGSIEPVIKRVKIVVEQCRDAVNNGTTAFLSASNLWPESTIVALGHHGRDFIKALCREIDEYIRLLPIKVYGSRASIPSMGPLKLELVDHQRMDEDILCATLIQKAHRMTQEQSQAMAVRLCRIWPSAYITENDVPISGQFMVMRILTALKASEGDFMDARVRLEVLQAFTLHWMDPLLKSAVSINKALSDKGWLPSLASAEVIAWQTHLNVLSRVKSDGGNAISAPSSSATSGSLADGSGRDSKDFAQDHSDKPGLHRHRAYRDREKAILNAMNSAPSRKTSYFDPDAPGRPVERLRSTAREVFLEDIGKNLLLPSMADVIPGYESSVKQVFDQVDDKQAQFAEEVLSYVQDIRSLNQTASLVDCSKLVRRMAEHKGMESISGGILQRLLAAQVMMRSLLADDTIPEDLKPFIIKLQLPWSRYLVQKARAIEDAKDPFTHLLWQICAISRRSNAPLTDGTSVLLADVVSLFDLATQIDAGTIDRAGRMVSSKWDEIASRAKLVVSRSIMSWEGQSAIEEKKLEVELFIDDLIAGKDIPLTLMVAIESQIKPALLFLGLKKNMSPQDESQCNDGVIAVQRYITNRLSERALVSKEAVIEIGMGVKNHLEAAGIDGVDFDKDVHAYVESRESVENAVRTPVRQPSVMAPAARPDQISEESFNEELTPFIEKASTIGVGSWLQCITEGSTWRGRIAARIAFKDMVVMVDRRGIKICELKHIDLALHFQSRSIKVIEDTTAFTKAIESMVKTVRQRSS